MPVDIRAVANIVIKEAWSRTEEVTNLQLNKVLFFVHVEYMRATGRRLTNAKIEAWEYGPVFREVYNQFKKFNKQPIKSLAVKVDVDSDTLVPVVDRLESEDENLVRSIVRYYSSLPVSLLVDLSHATGGAWDRVYNHGGRVNVGMEITDNLIRQHELTQPPRSRLQ